MIIHECTVVNSELYVKALVVLIVYSCRLKTTTKNIIIYEQQYYGEIRNELFLRTRPEILLFEPPRRFGSATAQTKALIYTITKNKKRKLYDVAVKSYSGLKKSANGQYSCQESIWLMRKTPFLL